MFDADIKILVSCHKKCYVPKDNDLLYPIQVGCALSDEKFNDMLHDDEGENISSKNLNYCELTAQYWAWKNLEADYYGFFHYRRYMSFSKERFAHNAFEDVEIEYLNDEVLKELHVNRKEMLDVISKYDVIATTPVTLNNLSTSIKNNYSQYSKTPYLYSEDLDVLLEIIKDKYPDYYDTAYSYLYKLPYGYFCNMFIMKKELFMDYSKWLFDILSEHEKRRNYSNYSKEGYRVSGHLAERLFGIYYEALKSDKNIKTCELQRTLFNNTDCHEVVPTISEENSIPIVIASNDYYAPYVSTLLLSICDTASDSYFYDVVLLSNDITKNNKETLIQLVSGKNNISLRIVNPEYLIDGYDLYTLGHFSKETYYRLILPDLMPEYEKILWIDVDMIVMEDLANLFNTDLDGYLLGAAYDADTSGLYNGYDLTKKDYMDSEMKLEDPYSYFQAGALVINLDEFRKTYSTKYILELAQSNKWQLLDQDILNILCEHRVKYIDMSWNVMFDYAGIRIKEIISLAPIWQYQMYMEARKHPKIIHFAGPEKPWLNPESDFAYVFWDYAKKTPYYELMLWRMAKYASKVEIEEASRDRREKRGPIYRTARCFVLYGPKHTFLEIKRAIRELKTCRI